MRQEVQQLLENPPSGFAKNEERSVLFEKQGKTYFQADSSNHVIQNFISVSSFETKKRTKKNDLGVLRNTISSYLFEYVEEFHISTHFVNKLSPTEMTVKKTESIPLTINIHNIDDGTFLSRFGPLDGKNLEFPVIEHFYSNGEYSTWVNESHVFALGVATPEEFKQMNRMASKVNAVIRGLCDRRQLALADARLQFGRHRGQVVLSDELSPFTCRFLDLGIQSISGRNRFLPTQDNATDTFAELCDRLMLKV